MKKTVNINLNGIVFHIDEDAYSTLQNYLNELSLHFDQEEGQEIMTDIEARIAEHFTDTSKGKTTLFTLVDVVDINALL